MLTSLALAAAPAPVPAVDASFNPRAGELIDSSTVLKAWAVRIYDSNRDGWLTQYEAQPAVAAFRDLADADRDGRITVREFDSAIAFISSRY